MHGLLSSGNDKQIFGINQEGRHGDTIIPPSVGQRVIQPYTGQRIPFGILAAAETPDMPRHDKVGPISEDHLDVATMGNIYTLQRQHSGLLEESTDPRLCLS